MDLHGRGLRRITPKAIVDVETPDVSPDGVHLAFAYRTGARNYDIGFSRLDGTHVRRLTRSPLFDEHPSWSPDGLHIAFSRTSGDGSSSVWLMNADGTRAHPITPGAEPAWSPDSARIAFTRARDIWVVRVDGTHARRLTHEPAADAGPAWSPDGRRIVFVSDRASGERTKGDLFVMNADGSAVERLTWRPDVWHFSPAWQPALRLIGAGGRGPVA
jgi:TolB protein